MLRLDLAMAEVDYLDADDRVFDFHALRHQYISSLSEAGVHPRVAQQLARHSSIELTMKRYTHLRASNVVAAVESVPEPQPASDTTLAATGTDDRWLRAGCAQSGHGRAKQGKAAVSDRSKKNR